MKKNVLSICIIILCIMIFVPVSTIYVQAEGEPAASDEGMQEEVVYESIDDYVKAHPVENGAVSYAYIKNGEIESKGILGYSDLTEGSQKKNDEETVFEWGEASQLLVWISMMQLYEEGKIDFEKDITAYLPQEYTDSVSIKYPITVRQLMNHSTGFQENIYERYVYEGGVVSGLGIYMINNLPKQTTTPGLCVSYSEYGICLGALIVSNVSGLSYEDYVKENIFARLDMNLTSVCPDQSDNERVKELYQDTKTYEDGYELGGTRLVSPYYPANMVIGSIDDYARLNLALLNENSGLFQNQSTYQEFFQPTLNYRNIDVPRISNGLYHYDFADSLIGVQNSFNTRSNVFYLNPVTKEGFVAMTNMYGEKDYTRCLPEFLFGTYKGEEDLKTGLALSDFEGIYLPAGTISKGKLSYYSLFSAKKLIKTADGGLGLKEYKEITPHIHPYGAANGIMDSGKLVHLAIASDGAKVLQIPEMDYLTYPAFQYRFGLTVFILQVINYAFATLVLTVFFVRFIYMKIKREEEPKHPFRKYLYIQCANIAFFTWVFLAMFTMALSYSKKALLDATSTMYYFGTLISVGYLIFLFQKKHNEETATLERVIYYVTGGGGVIMIVFAVFFRLIFGW